MKKKITENLMIILCGGRGRRMGEITKKIPKPMLKIGKKTIIEHKIEYYQSKGVNKYIFCLGYKSDLLKNFLSRKVKNSIFDDKGLNAGILKRIFSVQKYIKSDSFISYGDTLAKINFKDLISKHKKSRCALTIVVAPIKNPFGIVSWDSKYRAKTFKEKPIFNHFIGYSVISPSFFKKIKSKIVNLSDGKGVIEAIQHLIKQKQVNIYKFNNLQITINSRTELYNAKLDYDKYFTLNESNKK
jgi:glucose-1-phosphate cytidylyltransferase